MPTSLVQRTTQHRGSGRHRRKRRLCGGTFSPAWGMCVHSSFAPPVHAPDMETTDFYLFCDWWLSSSSLFFFGCFVVIGILQGDDLQIIQFAQRWFISFSLSFFLCWLLTTVHSIPLGIFCWLINTKCDSSPTWYQASYDPILPLLSPAYHGHEPEPELSPSGSICNQSHNPFADSQPSPIATASPRRSSMSTSAVMCP